MRFINGRSTVNAGQYNVENCFEPDVLKQHLIQHLIQHLKQQLKQQLIVA